ncbi:MAG: pyridoxamine 5'-phosphate oxidase family protein [Oscillospiraceae bacterium]|nr:pyridoxamine 5'-phosphate oxidase family protein [Oscillospiraceae bacterium]
MRRKDREVTDITRILDMTDRAKILHLGLFDGEYPYIVPMHYGYEYDGKFTFYLHCAKEGHKLDLIRSCPRCCVEFETDTELVSGGDIPCEYGSYYSSFIGQGTAEIVDGEEKKHGLRVLMRTQTGRDFDIDDRMAASVAVIRIDIDTFTAKARVQQ